MILKTAKKKENTALVGALDICVCLKYFTLSTK